MILAQTSEIGTSIAALLIVVGGFCYLYRWELIGIAAVFALLRIARRVRGIERAMSHRGDIQPHSSDRPFARQPAYLDEG